MKWQGKLRMTSKRNTKWLLSISGISRIRQVPKMLQSAFSVFISLCTFISLQRVSLLMWMLIILFVCALGTSIQENYKGLSLGRMPICPFGFMPACNLKITTFSCFCPICCSKAYRLSFKDGLVFSLIIVRGKAFYFCTHQIIILQTSQFLIIIIVLIIREYIN